MTVKNDAAIFNTFKKERKNWIKNPLTIGILLIMILPPLGVMWFMGLGWITLGKRLIKKRGFPLNFVSLFYLGLFVSSSVAFLTIHPLGPYIILPVPFLILGYLGCYLYIFEEAKENWEKWFQFYIVAVIVGGLYIVFFSLALKVFHFKMGYPFDYLTGRALLGTPPTPRLYGSTYNPNLAAYLLLLSFGFLLAYLLKAYKEKTKRVMLLLIVTLMIILAAILETGSRSAFVCMLFLIEFVLIRVNWKVAIAIVLVPLVRLHWFIHLIPRHGIIDLSYSNRLLIWKASFKIFEMHPLFGVSPAGFSVFYKEMTNKYVPHSHNIFIAFLSEYGIVGETMFLLLAILLVRYYFKLLLNKSRRGLFYSAFFILTLPIILFTGILDHPLFSPQVALPTVLLIAFFHRYSLGLKSSKK